MSQKFDARQSIYRGTLDQLSTSANPELDNLLSSVNTDLTALLRLSASDPASLVVNVGGGDLLNAESNRRRAIPHIGTAYVQFTSGTVTLPATSGGNITCSPGGTTTLTVASGNYAAILVYLDGNGNLNTVVGADAATEAAAITNLPPAPEETLALGFIVAQNVSGTIQNITQNKIAQFGTGSGGGSGGGTITEEALALRNSLNSTEYKYLAPVVFKTDKQEFVDTVNSTGTLNMVDSTYTLATGQILRTVNLLDAAFISEKQDIEKAMLTVFYKAGHVDTSATYEISRDNAVTWQTVTLTRNSQTTEFSGVKAFTSETLTTEGTIADTTDEVLNATTNERLSQRFTLAAARLVKVFTVKITKTGTPGGKITAKLVKDSSGNPSSANADLISVKTIDIPSLSAGINTVTIDFGLQMLAAGDYHIVFETNDPYKTSFVSGSHEVLLRTKSPFSGTEAKRYNGSSWVTVTNENIEFTYTYKVPSLLVRITASAASKITGVGVLYGEEPLEVSPVAKIDIIVGSQAQVDAGIATHSNIQNALNDAGFGRSVRILSGTYVGAVTISQSDLLIYGEGRQSIIQGNVTVSGDNNVLRELKVDGNMTFTAASENNTVKEGWVSGSLTDNGTNNSLTLIME